MSKVAPFKREAEKSAAHEIALAFDDNRLASLVFGQYDQNLTQLERRLAVSTHVNGNQVVIRGAREACEQARRVLQTLYARARLGQTADEGDVEGALEESAYQNTLFPAEVENQREAFGELRTRRRGVVRARNAAQDKYLRALRQHELVFAEGPAGTGKTWLAVGHAVSLLEQGAVERLVLSRPAVEAGERLGFLPGDMKDKVDPYLRPIYDALYDFMDGRMVERGLATGMIEIAPLAFMRGRTLAKAAILLDEAQNATAMQMKMFLTRLGEGSRMMVNGDPTQIDLAPGQTSGLGQAVALLDGLDRVGHVRFAHGDVVRHDLVRQIVEAYEKAAAKPAQPKLTMGPRVEFVETEPRWRRAAPARKLAREAVAAATEEARIKLARGAEMTIHLAADADLRELNRRWRSKDTPTNVLSFPAVAADRVAGARLLGDVFIALQTLEREATRDGKPFADHFRHLVAHGYLHLVGFDHETPGEAEAMEAVEIRTLARLGVADPYAGAELQT